jgi:hypothetical protein
VTGRDQYLFRLFRGLFPKTYGYHSKECVASQHRLLLCCMCAALGLSLTQPVSAPLA